MYLYVSSTPAYSFSDHCLFFCLGLSFDINRQICDFKAAVSNCDITAEETTPKPLFNTQEPICPTGELACADGTW